jgi:hypothetical protein
MSQPPLDSFEIEEIKRISRDLGYTRPQVLRLIVRLGLRQFYKTGRLRCGHYPCSRADCCGGALHPQRIISDGAGGHRMLKDGESALRVVENNADKIVAALFPLLLFATNFGATELAEQVLRLP